MTYRVACSVFSITDYIFRLCVVFLNKSYRSCLTAFSYPRILSLMHIDLLCKHRLFRTLSCFINETIGELGRDEQF